MSIRSQYIEAHGPIPSDFEVHHLLPKRLGGDDTILNLIAVSKVDHQKLHLLLYTIFEDFRDLCAYHMIGYNFSEAHKISSSIGGTIGGNKVKELQVGICTTDLAKRQEWAAAGGKAAQATLRENKIGAFYDPELKKIISSMGGKNGAFTKPEIQSELGKRGGTKNKGFIWITDGTLNKKYTEKIKVTYPTLEDYLATMPGWKKGRSIPKTKIYRDLELNTYEQEDNTEGAKTYACTGSSCEL